MERHPASPPLALMLATIVALLVLACGSSGAELDAARVRLELRYPITGQPDLRVTGQSASAPHGTTIVCRSTAKGKAALGEVAANDDGSFELAMPAETYPMNSLRGDFMDLNRTIECRAGSGPWVSPLRPPLVAIG